MTHSPLRVYADGLTAPDRPTYVRLSDGTEMRLAVDRYLSPADATDHLLLKHVEGPVLDVGCGPGRHLHALARRGVFALGVDLSPVAVDLARNRGGRAIVGSIFDEVPGAGTWRTALLIDGNIGIGGDPVRLLQRTSALLADDGEALVELDPPEAMTTRIKARLECGRHASAWFSWARVAVGDIDAIAIEAGFEEVQRWSDGGRWFGRLRRAA